MIRSVCLAVLASALPATLCADLVTGTAGRPDRHSQRYIETLADATRQRFADAADADAKGCRQEDNRYAFDELRDGLPGAGQMMLDEAAAKGLAEGRSVAVATPADPAGSGACRAAIEKLRAADDRLLVLSESYPAR